MSSAAPSPSEVKYLHEAMSDAEDAQRRADMVRRERRKSATAFFSQPASQRAVLSPLSKTNRVAPAPDVGPVKGRMTETQINRYVKKFPHLQGAEVRALESLFFYWDTDGSGEISLEEMMYMMERVVQDLFDKTDKDGSGHLDADEVRQLALQLGQNLRDAELAEAMEQMDGADGNGMISFDEFESWWLGKGGSVSSAEAHAEELADLFSEVDTDGSGAIDVDEFIGMIAGKMDGVHVTAQKAGAISVSICCRPSFPFCDGVGG
jgi:Ca2+-binding EF-hand superfamily protein